jgi:hypothetical protein
MAKKAKVPKKLLGFRLSKGTRKDIKKLLKMLGHPERQKLATTVISALVALLTERMAARQMPSGEPVKKRPAARPH